VPTHGRCDRLPELLDALAPQPLTETIVVVSASHDGSLELLQARAREDDRLKPIFVEEPGAALARQAGVESASSDVVLMLDDDVIPAAGLVDGHLRHHSAKDRLVVLGYMPVVLPRRRRAGQFPLDLYARAYEMACEEYERDSAAILKGLWGGNISMRRSDCLAVGLTREDAQGDYSYHEDLDFGLRCEAAGLEGVFDRRLLATHRYERTPESFIRDAGRSGQMRVAIHAEHAGTVGPLPEDFYERGTPAPGRWLIRWSRNELLRAPIELILHGVMRAAGALRLFRLESHAGYLRSRIEQQQHAFGRPGALGMGSENLLPLVGSLPIFG
jgi:GT2 family glycosyltransferase